VLGWLAQELLQRDALAADLQQALWPKLFGERFHPRQGVLAAAKQFSQAAE
jgi:hypothetical protein